MFSETRRFDVCVRVCVCVCVCVCVPVCVFMGVQAPTASNSLTLADRH